MYLRYFAEIYGNMLKSLKIGRKKFTKLKFITKYFDKSTFSKSLKIIKIAYILHVYKVGRWYLSNKREIIQVLLRQFWKKVKSFQHVRTCFYLAVKRMNLLEFICFDVTFVYAVRSF